MKNNMMNDGSDGGPDKISKVRHYHIRAALFESGEHSLIGEKIILKFPDGNKSAKGLLLSMSTGRDDPIQSPPRTLGHLIALAGDYFGDPDHPVSTSNSPAQQFLAAYEQLRQLTDQSDAVENFIDDEIAGLNAAFPPSSYYESQSFIEATARLSFATNGRYLKLANTNWDHFGDFAKHVYSVGHEQAIRLAISASTSKNILALQKAYTIDAFACHFLTDLFSAGHLRTPRKALYDLPFSCSIATGLLAKAMHDEDSLKGLKVHNGRGDSWTAYGDKKLLDNEDNDNNRRVIEAVQISVDEVWEAYARVIAPNSFGAINVIPSKIIDNENHAAMFIQHGAEVWARDPMLNPMSHNWNNNWTILGALLKLNLQIGSLEHEHLMVT